MAKWADTKAEKGVLCGSDQHQEWLLPWWWERYSTVSSYPVTFCDFGMSEKAKEWCQQRGEYVVIEDLGDLVVQKENIHRDLQHSWEKCYTNSVWKYRPIWFRKPLAFLKSPYEKAVWIDLDCEILKPIDPLFTLCKGEIAMMREFVSSHLPKFHPSIVYNSGVVVFRHQAPIIEKWVESSKHLTHLFWGDEVLLSHLINEGKVDVTELPPCYNWFLAEGIDINAVIVHFRGDGGKEYIQRFKGFKPSLEQFKLSASLSH